MSPEAMQLADLMSAISERCWFAGWLNGTEFTLWDAVIDGAGAWGQDFISVEDVAELKRLSDACGGWFVWDEELAESFIPMAEWLAMYKAMGP